MASEPSSGSASRRMDVRTAGIVDAADITRTVRAVEAVLRCHGIVGTARLRLAGPPEVDCPVLTQVNVRYQQALARVQVTGPRGFIAATIADRLDRQIARLAGSGEVRVWPDPARPPLTSVTEPCPIVRHKNCKLLVGDPADAVCVMNAMDYDAHLFIDRETGEDSVVHWAGPLGVRFARQHHVQPPNSTESLPLTVSPFPTQRLSDVQAASRLCRYGLPFLFFTNSDSGRGQLLLRRYDGSLTVVRPAPPGPRPPIPARAA